ncbi:MAG TPA: M48 family metalloprotease [Solirubrobacterales bacterium]|nr:M48 family metalloprotease [Solirubrobacterales bacterium]
MIEAARADRRVLVALAVGAAVAIGAWIFAVLQLWQTSVPGDLSLPNLDPARYFTQHQLDRAASYQAFLRIDALLALIAQLVALGIYAVKGPGFVRESAAGRIGTGMLLGMLGLAFVWIAQLPFGVAELWWERGHDVSSQGYVDWLINYFLSAGGAFLFISLAMLIVMALTGVWRRAWWVAAAPALVAVFLAFAFVQPYLIPGQHPVRNPAIAADADRLAAKEGIPGTTVRVQDTHNLGGSPNAEATGLGPTQRVILWDTLLQRFPRSEVRVVLAHEFAHLSRHHLWKAFGFIALLALPIALVVALVTRRRGGLYEPTAVPLAIFVVAVLLFLTLPVQTAFTRQLEAEADWVALNTTHEPGAMTGLFQRLGRLSRAEPDPPEWDQFLFGDHPSVMQRIEMARAWRERNPRP